MTKKLTLIIFCLITLPAMSQEYKRMIAKGTYTVQEIRAAAEAHFAVVGKQRGKGYKPYKRWEYQALRNCDENGRLKAPEFYFNELEIYNSYLNQRNQNFRSADNVGNWEELGPAYWNQTSSWNPGVGRISSIAIDKTNTNHIIVGGETGGVWKTLDNGTSWTVLTDNLSNLNVFSLAIDPTNSSTYYWGSSNGNLFKSTDGGATWNLFSDTGNGDINKILIDPVTPNKMYCTVEGGGIFKSVNAGLNWTIIHPTATNGYDIEFKPGDTNTIYATGNAFYKSTNGGLSFDPLGNNLGNWSQQYVNGTNNWIVSNSNQNNSVVARTGLNLGLFYKGDYSGPITKLVTNSLNLTGASSPKLKFSFTKVSWSGDIDELRVFYKTSVGGAWIQLAQYNGEVANWSDITLNLPNPTSDYYIAFEGKSNYGYGVTLDDISVEDPSLGVVFTEGFETTTDQFSTGPKMIGVSLAEPSRVYVLEAANGIFGGFHRSDDNGATFSKLDHTDKNYFGYSSFADDTSGQAPRDMDIVVNPTNANEVHIAGVLTWMSTDAGVNFTITSQWVPENAAAQNIGYSHCDMAIMEYVNDKLYVGSDGGISIANNPTIVNSNYFTDITEGLGIRQFYKLGISQTNPVIMSGGSQDNGTSVYRSNGIWYDWLGADGMETFIDKNNSNILYGTSQYGGLYKSINTGTSYIGINSPEDKSGDWVTPFEQDPLLANTIYTGYDKVYKSSNGGSTWVSISQGFGENLNHLKIAPSSNLVMYASFGNSLYKTINGGTTNWTQLSGFSGSINSIAIHPTNPNKVAIATTSDQKVYVSNNGGITWISYLYDLPDFSAQALVWENNGRDGLYLGMNYGVYYIDNEFNTIWQSFSNNLPNVIISELEINYADNKLYAATYGRGLWRTGLFDPSLSTGEFELSEVKMFPNPASKEVNLLSNTDTVSIRVYDNSGKLVYFSTNVNLQTNYKIDTSTFSTGIYFVRINSKIGVATKKLIIQ